MMIDAAARNGTRRYGSYLDCADQILGMIENPAGSLLELVGRNSSLGPELPPDFSCVGGTEFLHRAFALATQI